MKCLMCNIYWIMRRVKMGVDNRKRRKGEMDRNSTKSKTIVMVRKEKIIIKVYSNT